MFWYHIHMEMKISFMKSLFLFTARNKTKIINLFRVLYAIIFIAWVVDFFLSLDDNNIVFIYNSALVFGRTALILFCITITPGILKRFGITWNIRTTIMVIRRQFGVLTFSFAFLHFSLMRLFPFINGDYILRFPLLNFELFGLLSLFFMFCMFLTSNDWSVRNLGKWWNRLHQIVYGIAWTIALHVAFVRISEYSYLILTFAILETISLLYFYLKPKKTVVPPHVSPV